MKEKQYATKSDIDYLRKVVDETSVYVLVVGDLISRVVSTKSYLQKLVEDKVNLDLIYGDMTLLGRACMIDFNEDNIEFLLKNGANVNFVMNGGYTALHLAAAMSDTIDVAKVLLRYGADENISDDKGYTPLDFMYFFYREDLLTLVKQQKGKLSEKRYFDIEDINLDSDILENMLDSQGEQYEDDICINVPFYKVDSKYLEEDQNKSENLKKRLLAACESGNVRGFKSLLSTLTDIDDSFLVDIINKSKFNIIKPLVNAVGVNRINNVFDKITEEKRDILVKNIFYKNGILNDVTGNLHEVLEDKILTELRGAYEKRNKELIKNLLATGIDITNKDMPTIDNENDNYKVTTFVESNNAEKNKIYNSEDLLAAIKSGDRDTIKKCMRSDNVDINFKDEHGKNAFMYAIDKGDNETLLEILKLDIDVNVADNNGKTLLMYAIDNNNVEIAKKLVERSASKDARDKYNASVLMHALKKGENMSFLIDDIIDTVDVNETANYETSILMYACAGGYRKAIENLVSRGAVVEHIDKNGYTAVGVAFSNRNMDLVKYLMENGALTLGKVKSNNTNEFYKLLSEVEKQEKNKAQVDNIKENAQKEKSKPVNATVSKKALSNVKKEYDKKSYTVALIHAAKNDDLSKLIKLVKPSNINMRDKSGKTCLMHAAEAGAVNAVNYLLDNNAYIDVLDVDGKSALYYACYNNHIDVVKILVNKGVGLGIEKPTDAFNVACSKGYFDLVKFLVENNEKVESIYPTKTPLMYACENGHIDIVKYLISNGANVNANIERTGETVLDFAKKGNNPDLIKYVKEQIEKEDVSKVKITNIPKEKINKSEDRHI